QPPQETQPDKLDTLLQALQSMTGRRFDQSLIWALKDFQTVQGIQNQDPFSDDTKNALEKAVHDYFDLEAQIARNPTDDNLKNQREQLRQKIKEAQEKRPPEILSICQTVWGWVKAP